MILFDSVRAAHSRGLFWRTVNNSDGNGGVPVPAERWPRVRAAVLHAAQQGARPPAQVTYSHTFVNTLSHGYEL